MRKVLLLVCVALALPASAFGAFYGFVNNTGNSPEDSIAITFAFTDANAELAYMATGDSIRIHSTYPNGLRADSLHLGFSNLWNGASGVIRADSAFGGAFYKIMVPVATLDGPSAKEGTYVITVAANDVSTGFMSGFIGTFTLLTRDNYSAMFLRILDSAQATLDSIQAFDDAGGSLDAIRDTVNAVIDSVQAWDDANGSWDVLRDTLQGIIDSLQLHDGWVAQQATLTSVGSNASLAATRSQNILDSIQAWDDANGSWDVLRDTLQGIIDTLQLHDNWVAQEATQGGGGSSDWTTAERQEIRYALGIQGTQAVPTGVDSYLKQTRDSAFAALDSLQLHDGWVATQASLTAVGTDAGLAATRSQNVLDSIQAWDNANGSWDVLRDTLQGIIDSLQLLDNWVATQTTLAAAAADASLAATRSLAVLDSIQAFDNPGGSLDFIRDTIQGIIDTLQLHDNWVAQEATQGGSGSSDWTTGERQEIRYALGISGAQAPPVGTSSILREIRDTATIILDTLQLHDGWVAQEATQGGGGSSDWTTGERQEIRYALGIQGTQAVPTGVNSFLKQARDSAFAALDTLQSQDGWVATQASLTAVGTDAGLAATRSQNILDSIQAWDNANGSWDVLRDTLQGIIDSLQLLDNWVATQTTLAAAAADASLAATRSLAVLDSIQAWDNANGSWDVLRDTLQGIIDSLQLHDDWVARQSSLATISTDASTAATQATTAATQASLAATRSQNVLDSIQAWDNANGSWDVLRDTLQGIIDSLQLLDNWVAQQVTLALVRDSVNLGMNDARLSALALGLLPSGLDSARNIFHPATGAANKDSVYYFGWRLDSPTLFGRSGYLHKASATVADTLVTKPPLVGGRLYQP